MHEGKGRQQLCFEETFKGAKRTSTKMDRWCVALKYSLSTAAVCNKCGKTFKGYSSTCWLHVRQCGRKESDIIELNSEVVKQACTICNRLYSAGWSYKNHMRARHKIEVPLSRVKCPFCLRELSYSHIKSHLVAIHSVRLLDSLAKPSMP
mmetsp:Transcript_20976/g.38845  ORF Transcript_20976/g.38845 Transcript_20976/m.38845 type:complete len:150 (+) Transcript_20976:1079-1528(+)